MDKAFDVNGEELHIGDRILETWTYSPFYNQEFKVVEIDEDGLVYYDRQEFGRLSYAPGKKLKKVGFIAHVISEINNELNS